jgi:membrane protein DedA with SNARE-associated domain
VAIIVTVGFFVMLGVVLTGNRGELGEAGIMLLGTLAAGFGAVINYYLGSSSGSAAKERLIARQSGV